MFSYINKNIFRYICLLGVAACCASQVLAQTDSVYWRFGTSGSATRFASFSSSANVLASSCPADTGNVNSTGFGSSTYTPLYLTNQASSTGTGTYTGASGEPTIRNNAKTGSFSASTSSYLAFTITPNPGHALEIKSISFGGQRTATGPTSYTIRTSADGYSTNIGTGTLASNTYGGAKKSHTSLSITASVGTPITVRIYTHNAAGTATGGNVFLDDIVIYYKDSLVSTCSTPAVPVGLTASGITFYSANLNWNSAGGALTYEYKLDNTASDPVSGTTITADTFYSSTSLSANTLYYFHVRSVCDTFVSAWAATSFTTNTTPPCDTPLSLAAFDLTISGATINWYSVTGAVGYQYKLDTSPTPPVSGTNTTDTFKISTGLTDNTTYYFHLRTKCVEGHLNSDWITISFTTPEDTASDTFKVMTWNLLNFTGSGRETEYRTVVDSAQPDIMVVQELSSTGSTAYTNFLNNVMNHSASTYSSGTFINGPDTDNGIYFRSSKFQFVSNTAISTALRDINQFKLKHIRSGDTLIIYSVHLKASSGSAEEAERADEVDALRTVTNALPSGSNFLVCGDFNIYGSTEAAYTKLTQNGSNSNGKFNDLLSMSGTWNNSSYAINHTQSPRTTSFGGGATGGMDDRFDMILFSNAITQAGAFEILSGSYKAYGNDGQHYNQALNTSPFTMYSSTLVSAIHDASDHIPVIVNLVYNATGSKPSSVHTVYATENSNMLTVYPNPAQHTLFVKPNETVATALQVGLYDMTGKLIRTTTVSGIAGATSRMDLSGIPAGIYSLKAAQLSEVHKIVIQ